MPDHLCEGEWDSRIKIGGNWEDDGFFIFFIDQATGDIDGWHVYPNVDLHLIFGFCTHPNDGTGAHTIKIWEPRNGYRYRFSGVIVEDTSGMRKHKAKGWRRTIIGLLPEQQRTQLLEKTQHREATHAILADSDWEADKAT